MLQNRFLIIVTLLIVLVTLTFKAATASEGLTLTTDVSRIDVGVDFGGQGVNFTGQAPEGSTVYLRAVGPTKPIGLSKLGKKTAVWLPVESVTVEGMPGFFKVLSANGFANLSPDLQRQIGVQSEYASLARNATVTVQNDEVRDQLPAKDAEPYVNALMRIHEDEGRYELVEKGIRMHGEEFAGTLHLPANVPHGTITLEAFAVKDGVIVARETGSLEIGSTGLVALMSRAAREQSSMYGLAAILVALAAGFTVAQLFRKLNALLGKQDSLSAGH